MFKKIMLVSILLVLATSCTNFERVDLEPPTESELNILISTGLPTVRQHYINDYIKEFKESYPYVNVNVYNIPMENVSVEDLMHDYKPDIMEVTPFLLDHYEEYFTDLSGYVEMDRVDLDDFYPVLLEHSKAKGHLKSIPYYYYAFLFFYNKDAFDQANLEYPTSDWTWEEAISYSTILADTHNNHGLRIAQMGEFSFLYSFMQGMGGSLLSEENGRAQGYLDSKNTIEGLEWFASSFGNIFCNCNIDSVVEQEVAILYDQAHVYNHLENESIGAVGMPRWKGNDPANYMWFSSLAIPESSNNKDVAWKFISGLLIEDNEISRDIAQQTSIFTRKSVSTSSGMNQHPIGSVMVEALEHAAPVNFFNQLDPYSFSNTTLLDIYEGQPIAPILREVARDWDNQLEEKGL